MLFAAYTNVFWCKYKSKIHAIYKAKKLYISEMFYVVKYI